MPPLVSFDNRHGILFLGVIHMLLSLVLFHHNLNQQLPP